MYQHNDLLAMVDYRLEMGGHAGSWYGQWKSLSRTGGAEECKVLGSRYLNESMNESSSTVPCSAVQM